MSNYRPDQIDLWLSDWARERRKILGIILPVKLEPSERLGKLRCTLGQVKEEGSEGAAQKRKVDVNGRFPQNFPEVYIGIPLEIHRAFCKMRGSWREVMDAHYVLKELSPKKKAAFLGIKEGEYWQRLRDLRMYLGGYLGIDVPPKKRFTKAELQPQMKKKPKLTENALLSLA